MPNKTIYVSEADTSLFEEAKSIAGEALSSVISLALREYVTRHREKVNGMKEISVTVGTSHSEREQRFVGAQVTSWSGFSDDREWWLTAEIYKTQKGNFAVNLITVAKASLLTDRKKWKESGDYLVNAKKSELFVGKTTAEFEKHLPQALITIIQELEASDGKAVEYLDI